MACFALCPREGLFFKDGKGWHASAAGRSAALAWPFPPTLLGALRGAWGRREEQQRQRPLTDPEWRALTASIALHRLLPLRRPVREAGWRSAHRMWPIPEDAFYHPERARVLRLDPRPRPKEVELLGQDDVSARERLWQPRIPRGDKPGRRPPWWTEADFLGWLTGVAAGEPPRHGHDAREALALMSRVDVHVAIDGDSQAAVDGGLFSVHLMETLNGRAEQGGPWEWAFALDATLPDDADLCAAPWTLGGDRKLARAQTVDPALFALPEDARGRAFLRDCAGIRLFVVTPALFKEGWLPDGLAVHEDDEYRGELPGVAGEVVLRAALIPRAAHLSGWDMVAKQPKPTLRLVPPGSVYYFEKAERGARFTSAEIEALWLAGLGQQQHQGLGRVVAGCWDPAPADPSGDAATRTRS